MSLVEFAEENKAEAPQCAIFYGPPKAGKTHLVGQLARKYKLIWLDIEDGAQTLLTALPRELWPNVTLIRVSDSQREPNAIKTLGKLFTNNAAHTICKAHGVINCIPCVKEKAAMHPPLNLFTLDNTYVVVTDSLTQLSDSALAHALGPVDTFDKKRIEFDHYDKQGILLKNILTAQQRLPCHSVIISHEEELEQEDGSKKVAPVGGTRNFSRKVARYFDHVVYCEVKNMQHRASSSSTASAKFQSGSRNAKSLEKDDDIVDLFVANVTDKVEQPTLKPPVSGKANSVLERIQQANAAKEGKQ